MNRLEIAERIQAMLPSNTVGKYDLLTVFSDPAVLDAVVKELSQTFQNQVDVVAAPEAIGWILGSAIARELHVGFIGIRKGGKLPYPAGELRTVRFRDYSGAEKRFEIPERSEIRGKRVLIADDWIETGAQMKALMSLLGGMDCHLAGLAVIGIDEKKETEPRIESGFLKCIARNL